MALEDLLGGLYQYNMGLPLQYANPYFSFLNNQAGNMAGVGNSFQQGMGGIGTQAIGGADSLGNSAMGLYGNLANNQAQMYASELPHQMEMAKFNSLAPALSGLLNQFGGFGSGIAPLQMAFNRPDVMSGYDGAVGNSFNQLQNATHGAYGAAQGAYNQAQGGVNQVGNQMANQWQGLQNRVFQNNAPEGPKKPSPRPSPVASPSPAPAEMPVLKASPAPAAPPPTGYDHFGNESFGGFPNPNPYGVGMRRRQRFTPGAAQPRLA